MLARLRVLETHLNGVDQADLLISLIPSQDAIRNPATVTDRRGMLDVEDDGLLRRTQFEALVCLLQMPAIDETRARAAWLKLSEVTVVRGEVSDALVSHAWFVLFVRLDQLDRVMKDLQLITYWHFEGHLNILWECLRLDRLEELGVNPRNLRAEEARRFS